MFTDILSDLELDLLNHLLQDGNIHLLEVLIKRFNFIAETAKTSLLVINAVHLCLLIDCLFV